MYVLLVLTNHTSLIPNQPMHDLIHKQKLDGPQARVADYFDVIAGTSTGGIVTAMLTTPAQNGRPVPAENINKFYFKEAPEIFSDEANLAIQKTKGLREKQKQGVLDWLRSAVETVKVWTITKLKEPEYDGVHLRRKIKEMVGNTLLADTLTNVVIPAYDMQNLRPIIFSTQQVFRKRTHNNLILVTMIS